MKHRINMFATAAALAGAASLIAGGIAIEIGKPSANPEAQALRAVLVVRAYACNAPEKTTLTATAEGVVNGKRETIPLKLIPLTGQSTYAVTEQWPREGNWVITLAESNPNFPVQRSLIVKVDGDAVDWARVTRLSHALTKTDVEAALSPAAVAPGF